MSGYVCLIVITGSDVRCKDVLPGLHVQNRFKVAPLSYKNEFGTWEVVKYSGTEDGRVELDPSDQNRANGFWKQQKNLPIDFDDKSQYVVLAGNNRFLL
jgi:hypothetical protein